MPYMIYTKLEDLSKDKSFKNIYNVIFKEKDRVSLEYRKKRSKEVISVKNHEVEKQIEKACFYLYNTVGYGNGAYAGLKLDNSPEWPIAFWSLLRTGYCPILIDFRASEELTDFFLKESNSKVIITQNAENIPNGISNVVFDDIFNPDNPDPDSDYEPQWADEIALCTSGTTANSKIYVYDGESMSAQISSSKIVNDTNPLFFNDFKIEKNMAFLPFHHVFGFITGYLWFAFLGHIIIYLPDRAPSTLLESCALHEVTHVFAVPLLWNNIASKVYAKAEKAGKTKLLNMVCNLSIFLQKFLPLYGQARVAKLLMGKYQKQLLGDKITCVISGGGHILPSTIKLMNAMGYYLVNGFGMTETGISSVEMRHPIKYRLEGSVGLPLATAEYKIVENENTASSSDKVGEIFIKGPTLHTARLLGGEKTAPDYGADGWFPTGDIGRLDASGALFIEGRIKDIIINESGENVYPDELESAFVDLAVLVKEYCIVGLSKEDSKYEDIALVFSADDDLTTDQKNSIREVISNVNKSLPVFKKITKTVCSKVPLPLANGIKIQRLKLKKFVNENPENYITFE